MRIVRESIEFERGKDPKAALDIGPNRKVKKGDRVEITYKGEKYTVTALDDEEYDTERVCVRSGNDYGRDAEYESRSVKTFNFIDDDGGICYAEAREWWDNEGNTVWNFEVPEYEDPVLESVEFERGRDPKKALGIGVSWNHLPNGTIVRLLHDLPRVLHDQGDLFQVLSTYDRPDGSKDVKYYDFSKDRRGKWGWSKDFFKEYFEVVRVDDNLQESVEFERGNDPYRSLRVGKGRLIKQGETFSVYYKGDLVKGVALEDEEDTGQANYLDFEAPDGEVMWAIKDKTKDDEVWYVPNLSESVEFERGKDPKEAMKLGRKKERTYLDLTKGDMIEAYSPNEERWIWVQAIEEKPANNWTKDFGDNFDIKVKILDSDYRSHFFKDDFEMIRIFIDSFDTWELIEN